MDLRLRQTSGVTHAPRDQTTGDAMPCEPDAGPDPRQPEIIELGSVPGFVVFDLPGAPVCAGGTRLAPDISVAEVALLARAMTFKFAALGDQVGGAKAGLAGDPADRAAKAGLMARYCAEIRPLVDTGRFLTGPDMGTSEEDFAPLREHRAAPAAIRAVIGGVPFEDVLTGFGVVIAAEAARRAGKRAGRRVGWPVGGHRGLRKGGRRRGTGGGQPRWPGGRHLDGRRMHRGPSRARRRAAARAAAGARG